MIKNAGPLRLLGGWRMLAILGAGEARREGRRRGDGLPGMAGAGNDPAAICGGNSAVFNQPLTTFLVVAMVWRLAVFALCSYRLFRRCWRLFLSPVAWAAVDGLRGGLGWLTSGSGKGWGVAEKGPVLPRIGGRVLPHILPTPPWTVGGGGKQAG